MILHRRLLAVAATVLLAAAALPSVAPVTGFADLATLGLGAPVVLRATIARAQRLSPRDAPGVPPGFARFLISAATSAAIVAPGEVPPKVDYLADMALDAKGKPPKLVGADVLLFLRPAPGAPGQYALVSAHGQAGWTPEADRATRAVLTAARSGTVPLVTGVSGAFRVPGAVPGEAESQFFLATADGKPVSLVVLTRSGQARKLTIALGDVIDDAAAGVKPGTLLWYRLACFLPKDLPETLAADATTADDYRFVLTSLGPCGRTF